MNYLKYVNALMGTNSVKTYSNGNISPITALPFGTNHFTLETRADSDFCFLILMTTKQQVFALHTN
jgi:putative alpha-1,2-mannosidase